MAFLLSDGIRSKGIFLDKNEYSGVKKAAGWLASDIGSVSGCRTVVTYIDDKNEGIPAEGIIAGTIGVSSLTDSLLEKYGIDTACIKGKREVFGIFIKDEYVIVAGSDKRGTIYGLLHISEAIGVSPLCFFGDVTPKKFKKIYLSDNASKTLASTDGADVLFADVTGISREPSVKYRGFFINDEWPAFGNWCNKHYDGFTVKCYEKVFEYLLRLKGNYMWPAMWSSVFSEDGPGLASAELADELGVVMGTSHHEPCCRAGEEFNKLKPSHPEYGTAWNFLTNREGITKFWEDGLKRNGRLENVITVGMRGEQDSKLFNDAGLQDNINVLKSVITCQKELIEKYTDGKSPLMLAVYKEVEEYYKGSSEVPGLKSWDGLDGVTLMLCDDNFGNLRLMMDDDQREHKGGYGMYYHFDYHGGPVSYEWVNSSYLPKIWEQMTTAYDFGIRDIWIVNVGDLKNQELPLSYFMDLAYDFDKYGTKASGNYKAYLEEWTAKQFAGLDEGTIKNIVSIADGYTRLNNIIKPEVMSEETFSIEHYGEAERILDICNELEKKTELIMDMLKGDSKDAFYSLIGFQALASFNLIKMQIYAAYNKRCAFMGRVIANKYAGLIKECIEKDKSLTESFHTMKFGKWYGMGMSKHIGFKNWNEEGCRMPVMVYVEPEANNEVVISDNDSKGYSGGGAWTRHPVKLTGFDYRGCGGFTVSSAGRNPVTYTVECQDPDIVFSGKDGKYVLSGMADQDNDAVVSVNVKAGAKTGKHEFTVKTNAGTVLLFFEYAGENVSSSDKKVFGFTGITASVPAEGYFGLEKGKDGEFKEIESFGRLLPGQKGAALKAYPQDIWFNDGPKAEYRVIAPKAGDYRLRLYTAPSNPSDYKNRISCYLSVNGADMIKIDTIPEGYVGGENSCRAWCFAVIENVRVTEAVIKLNEGENSIKLSPVGPGFVLEKLTLTMQEKEIPVSRLGA
ncbi:MAG: glycosyl hydrolase 115 family protein [Lachnospiraceae bacterium]|nr:glycosyl hydrolase 115 family protein [Lachnospiraceae bacterium]